MARRLLSTIRIMSQYNPDNVFRKILDGQIPSHKIFETEACIAILDAFPMAPGHSLLIPKGNYTTIADMPADEAAAFLKEVPRLTRMVQGATKCDFVRKHAIHRIKHPRQRSRHIRPLKHLQPVV
ncbi:hypothetical protein PTSG_09566 [Salpingoeca rosetta]|uniref:HIT domain-containing protein n=1 Tax=Salpingoeca rosetta (strain ATCC 50818 / BSB-021) TaxID=946362 RepID=F2ULD2_SALR5|nr:uncharacterized protein PTSG_09566 [Salpingoeca rosetta]EGD77931.1 hypothetical protein PTSG_09566 [Salpingoeca rosetta]|eukprot:XP_004989994.1 hypothetical protein PTSG_09566 [Salpingoeca rosetta]